MCKSLRKPEILWDITGRSLVKASLAAVILAVFFYRSLLAVVPMLIPGFMYVWWENRKKERDRNEVFLKQFEDCILSVCSCVRSGYAAENAFLESIKDMELMYGKDAQILKELRIIKGGLDNHSSLEQLLKAMGIRTQLREVMEFADVFEIAKQNGANMAEVIESTARQISANRYLQEEMKTVLASKILEGKIMKGMPFLLMIYVESTTPGYFSIFYGNTEGVLVMSLFLLWYMAAYALSECILWRLKKG